MRTVDDIEAELNVLWHKLNVLLEKDERRLLGGADHNLEINLKKLSVDDRKIYDAWKAEADAILDQISVCIKEKLSIKQNLNIRD